MNSSYDWIRPYVLRWGYDHRRAMQGAPAAAARVAEADFDGLLSMRKPPVEGLSVRITAASALTLIRQATSTATSFDF